MNKISENNSLNSMSLGFVEDLYEQFLHDPGSVPPGWKSYFTSLDGQSTPPSRPGFRPTLKPPGLFSASPQSHATPKDGSMGTREWEMAALQHRVDQLIRNYRVRGHMVAMVNPLGGLLPRIPELDPAYYGFTEVDLDRPFSAENVAGAEVLTLRKIIQRLANTYCRSIGVQFMHIDELAVREWLQERMEGTENRRLDLSRKEQLRILTRLTDAVIFEEFIQRKYVGAKSFSLEGSESLIPLLDLAIEKAGADGIDEIVMAMAHRGRLNVLVNIIRKSPAEIFREFEDRDTGSNFGGGDVKYHLGYSSDWITAKGRKIHLSLCFNPSHLEYVNPVALGRMRAKQDQVGDTKRERGLVIMIHGDAAFAGEGVVQETLNLSELNAYTTGGSIHIIVNNMIGFTTPPSEGRSAVYASGLAKMLQIPIFHVNGEDPEAVAQVVDLAMEFRRTFKRDVVINMYGYRRHGHNESDEPSFTQPVLYKMIARRKALREGYLEHLLKLYDVSREEADQIAGARRQRLEEDLSVARSVDYELRPQAFSGIWKGFLGGSLANAEQPVTGVEKEKLASLLEAQTRLPEGFNLHPKLKKFMEGRQEMARGDRPLDWSAGEALAYASLAVQGFRVRMSGQDSARGTFSHRHAVLHDYKEGNTYCPLQHLEAGQAPVEILNSSLSEAGVMGFEYGYSLDCPNGLIVWEAQFGDFANAAQVIIDQFITSGEDKWRRLSGLVLLLPHGFEGMGPEHSSARLERFLAMGAEDNIQVIYPTTPAQFFHSLRRQVLARWRKPLVVMTPKSLLRHAHVVSTLDELATGSFQWVIPDALRRDEGDVERVLLCTGKIYYELEARRAELKREDVAIVRVEQLYPLREDDLRSALSSYREGTPVYWVQEEPENMGAWRYMSSLFGRELFEQFPFSGISRAASASPATGSARTHKIEQEELLALAFGGAVSTVSERRSNVRRVEST